MSVETLSCHPTASEKVDHVPVSRGKVIEIMQGLLATETHAFDQKLLALAKLEQEVQEARLRVASVSRALQTVENAMEVDAAERREEIVRLLEEVPPPQMRAVLKALVRGLRQAEMGSIANLSLSTESIFDPLCHFVREVVDETDLAKVEEVAQCVLLHPTPNDMYRTADEEESILWHKKSKKLLLRSHLVSGFSDSNC